MVEKKTIKWKACLFGGMLLIAIAGIVLYQTQQDSKFRSRLQTTTSGFKKADVSRLLQVLNGENADHGDKDAERAAVALGQMGSDAIDAVPALIDKLFHARNTGKLDLQKNITGALVGIGKAAVPELSKQLDRATVDDQKEIINIIRLMGSEAADAVPALIDKLYHARNMDNRDMANNIGETLVDIGKAAVPELIKELGKETADDPEAVIIMHILFLMGSEAADAVPLLCQRLQSNSLRLREAATLALGKINANPSRSVPALISVLNDSEAGVRSKAISAIVSFEPSEEIIAALARRKDDRVDVRTTAKTALFKISENATNPDLRSAASKAVTRFPVESSQAKVNNLRQIGLAMSSFENTYGQLPIGESNRQTPVRYRDGKPLLSWRVHLLPFLEQDPLYGMFKLDEPWDSPHNIKLLDHMPDLYKSLDYPGLGHKTVILGMGGPSGIFALGESRDAPRAVRSRDIPSLFAVALVVMAQPEKAVLWTKPDEFVFDPKKPRQGLTKGSESIPALFTNGSVRSIGPEVSSEELLQLFRFRGAR